MCDRYPQRRFAWLYHKQPQRFSWLYHKQPRRFLWLYQKQPHRFSWLYHKQPRRFLWLYHKQPRRFSWLYHKQPGRFFRMYQKHPTKLKCKRKHMQTSRKRKQSCRENEKTEICKKLTCWECCKCSYTSVLRCMSKTAFKCQERPCLQCRRYAYAKASVGSRTVVNRYQSWVLPYFKSFARNSQVRISLQNSTIANVMLKVGASIKSFLGLQDLDYLYAGCRFAGEANPSEEHVCTCALATCNLPTALPREKLVGALR